MDENHNYKDKFAQEIDDVSIEGLKDRFARAKINFVEKLSERLSSF